MKQYTKPEARVVFLDIEDVLTASTGEDGNVSETPKSYFDGYDYEGNWL